MSTDSVNEHADSYREFPLAHLESAYLELSIAALLSQL